MKKKRIYNIKITIQRLTEVEINNINKIEFVDYKTIWSKAEAKEAKENTESKKTESSQNVEFEIRYKSCPDISKKDRILFKGDYFNITSVDNVDYKNIVYRIIAEEVTI